MSTNLTLQTHTKLMNWNQLVITASFDTGVCIVFDKKSFASYTLTWLKFMISIWILNWLGINKFIVEFIMKPLKMVFIYVKLNNLWNG